MSSERKNKPTFIKSARNSIIAIMIVALSAGALFDHLVAGQQDPAARIGQISTDGGKPTYEPGAMLVKFKAATAAPLMSQLAQGAREAASISLPRSLQSLNRKYRVSSIEQLFDPAVVSPANFARINQEYPDRARRGRSSEEPSRLDHIFKLRLDTQVDIVAAAKEFANDPNVEYAQPNNIVRVSYTPNDQFLSQLWGMTKIQAPTAWDKGAGDGFRVAVIDTGVDFTHPEFTNKIWGNKGESGPFAQAGVDDDNNGYIDDFRGWDFAYGDNDPLDKHGHGTHVAGTIAAAGNNGIGVVGLAYNSWIIPIKGLDDYGWGYSDKLAQAILYADLRGADVINNSWGGQGSDQTIADAIVTAHAHGVVIVSAAGNSAIDASLFFPANIKESLAVAATDANDQKAGFSNFGPKLDVAAPGVGILSTAPVLPSYFETGSGLIPIYDSANNKYLKLDGTSMAAPHVSALAALLIRLHPTWTNEEIRQAIRQTADDLYAAGFDQETGYGRINAAKAASHGDTPPPVALITEPAFNKIVSGTAQVKGFAGATAGLVTYQIQTAPGNLPPLGAFVTISSSNSPVNGGLLASVNTLNLADGLNTIRLVVKDSLGQESEDRVVITVDNVKITSPINNQMLTGGSFNVMGITAGNTGFQNYTLEWAPGCNATSGFNSILTSATQATSVGSLGNWNLASLPDGSITLRLTANFTAPPSTATHQVCVIVDKLLAPGWPAAIVQTPTAKSPKIADLDGDGTNEVIVGSSVFQANGSVRAGWDNFPGMGRTNPVILNLDGNKNTLEVVTAYYDDDPIKPDNGAPVVYAYNHAKTVLWSFKVQNPNFSGLGHNNGVPSSLSAGDVDSDGQLEIVFTMYFNEYNPNNRTRVFVLNGATGALEQSFWIDGIGVGSVALADIDRDWKTDLVIASRKVETKETILSVVGFDGTPRPNWPKVNPGSDLEDGWYFMNPVIGNIEHDCYLEILAGRYLWSHNGQLRAKGFLQSRSTGVFAPLPDGDPFLEVVFGGANHIVFSVADHNGAGKFDKYRTFENAAGWDAVGGNVLIAPQGNPIAADIDGDGLVEIVRPGAMAHTSPEMAMPIYASKSLSNGDPTGFSRFVTTTSNGFSDIVRSTPAVGDVDKDGQTDLVVAAGGKVYLWNLKKPYKPAASFWPMFQHNLSNTGTVYTYSNIVCKDPIPTLNAQ